MARSVALCLLALTLFGAVAQAAQAQQKYPTFAAALGNSKYSKLKTVADNLGLTKTLSNPALKVTIFVPNDEAFATAAARSPIPIDSLMQNKSIMQQIVYYHIVKDVVKAPLPNKQMTTFVANRFLQGDGMKVKAVGNSADIVEANIEAGAGVAHIVNHVLLFVDLGSLGRK